MVLTKTKAIIELSTIETQTASLSAWMLSNSRTVGKGEQLVRPSSGKQQIKVQLCVQVLVNQQPLQSDHSPIHPANKSSEYWVGMRSHRASLGKRWNISLLNENKQVQVAFRAREDDTWSKPNNNNNNNLSNQTANPLDSTKHFKQSNKHTFWNQTERQVYLWKLWTSASAEPDRWNHVENGSISASRIPG